QQIIERVLGNEKIAVQRPRVLEALIQGANVSAGAKCFIARTFQQNCANLRIRCAALQERTQLDDHLVGQRIERGGAIQRDERHAIANFAEYFVMHSQRIAQTFFQAGFRFAKTAFTPSCWSSPSNKSMNRSRSSAKAALRGVPSRA